MSASQNPPNDGNHAVGMIIEDGYVVVRFQHAITFLRLEPQNCLEIAGGLLRLGMEIKTGKPLDDTTLDKLLADTKKDIKIDQAREVLINRMILMLKGFETSAKPIDWKARQVVDTILVEVT
jgi:hypothetical protein